MRPIRSRAVLLLVLASALGVFAYQQATKPPQYSGPPPAPIPPAPPTPWGGTPADVAQPPEADLQEIAEAFRQLQGDRIEAKLRDLHQRFPDNARVLSYLARLEYNRAIAGRAQSRDMSFMFFDPAHMSAAAELAEKAVYADPELFDAWLTSAWIALARSNVRKAVEMVERAEALDPTSVALRRTKGDVLLALAEYSGEKSPLPLALKEYELILQAPLDSRDEFVALRKMGETWVILGDEKKAIGFFTQAIEGFEGSDQAFALESRARAHLRSGNADAAIKDSQAALEVIRFGVAAHTLADAHLVKAGMAVKAGNEAAAAPHLDALLQYDPDPTSHVSHMASDKGTFPAVFAMFAAPMRDQHWDRVVPEALSEAAGFITAADLRKLSALGIRFDAGDTVTNTLLFEAINYDNVEAVRTLLALDVDTSVRRDDGASLLDMARIGTSPARKEIRKMLLAKMGRPPGWTDVPVDLPKRGSWYRADRSVGVAESPSDKVFEQVMTLLAGDRCSITGRPYICQSFYTAPGVYYSTILIPISSPEDLNALREVDAPTP